MTDVKAHDAELSRAWYEEALGREGDPDYEGLQQGVTGTSKRHMAVVDLLGGQIAGGRLLDLGCGTGLLLDVLAERGVLPEVYLGVDMLNERGPHVGTRLHRHGVSGRFVQKDAAVDWHRWPLRVSGDQQFDVAVMCGVFGPWDHSTYRKLHETILWMQNAGRAGLVTVPIRYGDVLGERDAFRFSVTDVRFTLSGRVSTFGVYEMPRDAAIYWTPDMER